VCVGLVHEVPLVVLIKKIETSSLQINENLYGYLEEWLLVEALELTINSRITAAETRRIGKNEVEKDWNYFRRGFEGRRTRSR